MILSFGAPPKRNQSIAHSLFISCPLSGDISISVHVSFLAGSFIVVLIFNESTEATLSIWDHALPVMVFHAKRDQACVSEIYIFISGCLLIDAII